MSSSSGSTQDLRERKMELRSFLVGSLPFAAMATVEFLDVGLTTLSKAAMSRGMSHFVFVVYSNALGTLVLFPSSFILLRRKRPPLTFSLLCKFFLLGLVGITVMQNCVFTGINYSSPTLASAMSNLMPAFAFLLAAIFRMEEVNLRSLRSIVKILGTLVSIIGALIVTLYKGSPIDSTVEANPTSNSTELPPLSQPFYSSVLETENNWIIGALFLGTASFSLAVGNTAQAAILKGYPSELTMVSFYCLFGTIQCAAVSLIAERNPNAWKIKPDIELTSIIYSALFGSVVTYSIVSWCIRKKGPVFVAMFKPFGIAAAALMSAIFLNDTLHVGSVIGAVVIAAGFYGVIWAQSKEEVECEVKEVHKLPSSKAPLLQSHLDA